MTAEKVAENYGIGREVQDAFAAESQRRAAHAIQEGFLRDEIVIDQIDLVELNEAFAAQSLACIRELGVDPEKVNAARPGRV